MSVFYNKHNLVLLLAMFFISSCSTIKNVPFYKEAEKSISPQEEIEFSDYGAFLAGLHARINDDLASAADFYILALKKDPNNVILLKNCYSLLASQGRIEEAYEYAQRLSKLGHSSGVPSLLIASKQAKDGDFDTALKTLKKGLSSRFTKFFLPLMNSWLYVGKGDTKTALKELNKLKKNKQLQSFYHFHAGLINDIAGNTEKAKENFEIVLSSSDGRSIRAIQIIGNFYRRHNMPEKALELIDEFRILHPESLTISNLDKLFNSNVILPAYVKNATDGLSEAMFSIAATMNYGSGNDLAILFTRLSIYLKEDFNLAFVLLGELLEQRANHIGAIDVYSKIPKDDVSYLPSLLKRSFNHNEIGNSKEAISLLEEAISIKEDLYSAYSDMGDIYRINEEHKKAIKAYTKAIEMLPSVSSRYWVLFYARGISYERLKNWEASEKDLLKALELEPDQPLVLNYLGYSWLEHGKNIKKSLEMLESAYEQRPQDGYIADSLGWAYFLSKKYEKALSYLEEAVSLEPGNSVINHHLGDAYWKMGRKNEAFFAWEKALTLNNDLKEKDKEILKKKIKSGYVE